MKVSAPGATRVGPDFGTFSMSFGGGCERYTPAQSFWGGTPRPTSVSYKGSALPKVFNWSDPTTGVLHGFHSGHWGGWMFRITGHDAASTTIVLDPWGGQQEARGSTSGAEWYVENLLEELDSDREWFLDAKVSPPRLYYKPNATGSGPPPMFVVPQHESVFKAQGNQTHPVRGIRFSGITYAHTTTTFLGTYEVGRA